MVRIQGGEESSALVMPRGDELGWRLEDSSREDWLRGGSRQVRSSARPQSPFKLKDLHDDKMRAKPFL